MVVFEKQKQKKHDIFTTNILNILFQLNKTIEWYSPESHG